MIASMERFDEHIKTDFPEHDTPADIEAALTVMHGLKIPECDGIGLSPVSKVPAQMMILTQVALRRSIELIDSRIAISSPRRRIMIGWRCASSRTSSRRARASASSMDYMEHLRGVPALRSVGDGREA